MKKHTCKIMAQIGMSLLVLSGALADDGPGAATQPSPVTHASSRPGGWGGGRFGGGGGGNVTVDTNGVLSISGSSNGGGGGTYGGATSGSATSGGALTITGGNNGGFGAAIGSNGPVGPMTVLNGKSLILRQNSINIADRPIIITTQAIDAQGQSQLKEDLNIMDKLVLDAVAHSSGEAVPRAMGIRLLLLGNNPPMYVEGAGTIFTASVNRPLSATTQPDANADQKASDPTSPWERAKAEVGQAHKGAGDRSPFFSANLDTTSGKSEPLKVDELVDAVAAILPQARNIRALKSDESVIVTIVGTDADAAPISVTIKAKKSDIDQANSGKIPPEEFKQRLAKRIG